MAASRLSSTARRSPAPTDLILTPGNYGEDFLKGTGLDRLGVPVVKYSNFLGDALDIAVSEGSRPVQQGHAGVGGGGVHQLPAQGGAGPAQGGVGADQLRPP